MKIALLFLYVCIAAASCAPSKNQSGKVPVQWTRSASKELERTSQRSVSDGIATYSGAPIGTFSMEITGDLLKNTTAVYYRQLDTSGTKWGVVYYFNNRWYIDVQSRRPRSPGAVEI